MIKELARVVLTAPIPDAGLEVGDVGTVVHAYPDGRAFEVEFTTLEGATAAVVTVEAADEQNFSSASAVGLSDRRATQVARYERSANDSSRAAPPDAAPVTALQTPR